MLLKGVIINLILVKFSSILDMSVIQDFFLLGEVEQNIVICQ